MLQNQHIRLHHNYHHLSCVAVSDILYIDTLDHQTTVHLNDKTSIVTREPLNSYLVQKAFSGFIQISSSCIVNHVHIYSNFNLKTI